MEPHEVEKWLIGLGSLISKEASQALTDEVRRQHMDGEQFSRLVASRTMPALGDAVRPRDMATLRRCWTSSFGSIAPAPSSCTSGRETPSLAVGSPQLPLRPGGSMPGRTSSSTAPLLPRGSAPMAPQGNGSASSNAMGTANLGPYTGNTALQSRFAPPPRAAPVTPARKAPLAQTGVGNDDRYLSLPFELASPMPLEGASPGSPDAGYVCASDSGASEVVRPPQVPRLDLSGIHGKAVHRAKNAHLNDHAWLLPENRIGTKRPMQANQSHVQGFSTASSEDKQRIAEFYGYRDEGFTTTMSGLRTDMIRPRLFVGNMADAAYRPLLANLEIEFVLNCAVEAQKAPPPYKSDGIQYMLLPFYDSVDQTQLLIKQRYRGLKEATKFINSALKGKRHGGAVLVHCVQGLSRSASIVCAYLMEYEGVSLDRALTEVRTKHPGCLTGQHWQNLLYKYNAELLKGG